MTVPFPGPTVSAGSRAEVFVRYLDYFRDRVRAKLRELPDDELRRSRLPSGWTPIELLRHLTYVELRWLEWGFEGHAVNDPWGDRRDDRWYVGRRRPSMTCSASWQNRRGAAGRSSKPMTWTR